MSNHLIEALDSLLDLNQFYCSLTFFLYFFKSSFKYLLPVYIVLSSAKFKSSASLIEKNTKLIGPRLDS